MKGLFIALMLAAGFLLGPAANAQTRCQVVMDITYAYYGDDGVYEMSCREQGHTAILKKSDRQWEVPLSNETFARVKQFMQNPQSGQTLEAVCYSQARAIREAAAYQVPRPARVNTAPQPQPRQGPQSSGCGTNCQLDTLLRVRASKGQWRPSRPAYLNAERAADRRAKIIGDGMRAASLPLAAVLREPNRTNVSTNVGTNVDVGGPTVNNPSPRPEDDGETPPRDNGGDDGRNENDGGTPAGDPDGYGYEDGGYDNPDFADNGNGGGQHVDDYWDPQGPTVENGGDYAWGGGGSDSYSDDYQDVDYDHDYDNGDSYDYGRRGEGSGGTSG